MLMVGVLFGVLIITFVVSHVIPADPVGAILGGNAPAERVDALRHQLGLDQPLHVQFITYLGGVIRGDLGRSLRTGRAVSRDIGQFFLAPLVMPAFVLGYLATATIARICRSSMLDVLHQEYIRTAQAKGLRPRVVILRHALRNALIPTVTVVGLVFGGLLEGSVLTETIFAWPGLGRYITTGFLALDYPAVMGGTLYIAVVFSVANLLVDIAYAFLDPKIRF